MYLYLLFHAQHYSLTNSYEHYFRDFLKSSRLDSSTILAKHAHSNRMLPPMKPLQRLTWRLVPLEAKKRKVPSMLCTLCPLRSPQYPKLSQHEEGAKYTWHLVAWFVFAGDDPKIRWQLDLVLCSMQPRSMSMILNMTVIGQLYLAPCAADTILILTLHNKRSHLHLAPFRQHHWMLVGGTMYPHIFVKTGGQNHVFNSLAGWIQNPNLSERLTEY